MGCTSLRPREAFPEVAQQVEQRTGARVVWNRGSAADEAVDAAVRELLGRELAADSAVQVAVLNNSAIQATYEELSIAQAELVQAGLLSNPVFSALIRLPEAGAGDPNIELSVSQNFIELLSLPLRRKVAAAQYDAAKARVAGEVIELAAEVKSAFYMLQGAQQALEMRRTVEQATAASLEAARRLRQAGNITELALTNEQALHEQSKLETAEAEARAGKDLHRLQVLLGLSGAQAQIRIAPRLPALPADENPNIEEYAVKNRLDLAASVRELNAAYQRHGLTRRFAWFGDAEVEVEAERETDGEWLAGPGVSVPIPIFDTGAAQVSIARSQLRQAEHRVHALAVQVRGEARTALAEMRAAHQRAAYYQTSLLPLRRKITHETQLHYNAMQIGLFELFAARREEIEAGHDYIEALRDYWLARTELERAVGGKLPEGFAAATQPAPEPAPVETNDDHNHLH